MNLYEIDPYNENLTSSDLRDLRDGLMEDLKGSYPGATDEHLAYLANLSIGMLFAHPGLGREEIEAKTAALHQSEVAAGNPLAIGLEDALIDTVYRPVYEAAVLLKTDPAKALRSKFGMPLKEARRLAERFTALGNAEEKSGKEAVEPAESTPLAVTAEDESAEVVEGQNTEEAA